MTVPPAFQAHFFWKYARSQFVLFAEVYKSYARFLEFFDHLHLYITIEFRLHVTTEFT